MNRAIIPLLMAGWWTMNGLVRADQEPPLSLQEMEKQSKVVADGEVTDIVLLKVKETPHPNGIPVRSSAFRAVFRVDQIIKGAVMAKGGKDRVIYLEYQKTPDARYRGDQVPDFKVGDRFRLYARTVRTGPFGETTAFLNTPNDVRPEALEGRSDAQGEDNQVRQQVPALMESFVNK